MKIDLWSSHSNSVSLTSWGYFSFFANIFVGDTLYFHSKTVFHDLWELYCMVHGSLPNLSLKLVEDDLMLKYFMVLSVSDLEYAMVKLE